MMYSWTFITEQMERKEERKGAIEMMDPCSIVAMHVMIAMDTGNVLMMCYVHHLTSTREGPIITVASHVDVHGMSERQTIIDS